MKENYINDKLDFEISESRAQTLQDDFKSFKDEEGTDRYLEVEVDVTHGGYVNRNFYYYDPDGQAKGALSFIRPFQKPILAQHDSLSTPIGRTVAAAFIPLTLSDRQSKDVKTPKCKIRVKGVITEKDAIEHILTKRYLTVSTGGSSLKPPECSICGTPVESIGPLGSYAGCDHRRGKVYEDEETKKKQLCYWNIGQMNYKEWSFVNMPADYTPKHVAAIVSMRWVDNVDPQDSVTLDEKSSLVDSAIDSPINDTEQKGGIQMADEKKNQELVSEFLDAMVVLDECEECDENVSEEWKEDKEIEQAKQLDGEFTDSINSFLPEDKKLPPAGSKEREKLKTKFCGPNKTFPIPDCKHAAVAMAMLNFPRVKSKYSSSVRARIASCVRGRAKTLGCPMSKKKTDSEVDIEVLQKDLETAKTEVADLKTKGQEKDSEIKTANEKIENLQKEIKTRLAEKVVDLSMMSERPLVEDVLKAEDVAERKAKYADHVKKLSERTEDSLKDSIIDLSDEVSVKIDLTDKVEDPNKENNNNNNNNNNKTVAEERKEKVKKILTEK